MQKGRRLFLTVVGIVASLVYLFPFYIMLTNSFKTKRELFLDTLGFPEKINLENYILAWERLDFPRAFMNSLLITVGSIIVILIFSAMAGWKLERTKTKTSTFISQQTSGICGIAA